MILKVRTVLLGILISSNLSAFAQIKGDTTQAHKYYIIADSLLTHADYDSSIFYFEKAADLYGIAEAWQKHINCYNKISENYWSSSKFDLATASVKRTLKLSTNKLGNNNLEEALAYHNWAIIKRNNGKPENALTYEKRALNIRRRVLGQNHLNVASSYESIAGSYYVMANYKLSLNYLDSSLKIMTKLFDVNHIKAARTYSNLGFVYFRIGNYDFALEYLKKALKIRVEEFGSKHAHLIGIYNYYGLIYLYKGEHNLALSYFNKALEIRKARRELYHIRTAHLYVNIGLVYQDSKNGRLSRKYQRKALEIRKKLFGKYHDHIADNHINIGKSYFFDNDYDSALYHSNMAIRIYRALHKERHFVEAEALNNIGLIYKNTENYEDAIDKFDEAVSVLHQVYQTKHPDLAFTYNNLAETFAIQNKYQEASKNYQKAIQANILNYDVDDIYSKPKLENYLDANELLQSMISKAKCFEKMALESGQLKNLTAAIDHYELSDQLIDKTRQSRQNHQDKIDFIKTASQVYEGAIRITLLLHEETGDSKYLLQAFYFAEKSKSGVLKDALSRLSAKSFGSIPDSLFQAERDIRSDLTFYTTQVQLEKAKENNADSAKIATWEHNVSDLTQRSDSLAKLLERDYPKYFDLKYKNKTITVGQVQEALAEEAAFLEYFMGDSASYVFLITKDKYDIITLTNAPDRQVNISEFRASLEQIASSNVELIKNINTESYKIYQTFLEPVLSKLDSSIERLVVIPEGALSYLPLDILLTEYSTANPTALPYLIHKYQIQYGYSATLLYNDFEQESKGEKEGLIAFAPSYDNLEGDSSTTRMLGNFRDQVTSLKWNTPEVKNIGKLMNGETFTGKAAVERTFKEKVPNANVIHLAMHALVDDEDPMKSRLVFAQEKDSVEDNFLHAYELYNMELPADLAVLSACETGFGKLAKGEGVMSLARAFSYAGCPSVVMSHWAVNDAVTAKLMKSFYQYLADGLHKDAALRKAKLDFLSTADPLEASPYFWGSFVVMGDVSPLDIEKEWSWWYALVALLLLLIATVSPIWRGRLFRSLRRNLND